MSFAHSKQKFHFGEADAILCVSSVLQQVESSDYEYNTDGLIFTPSRLGVGADQARASVRCTQKNHGSVRSNGSRESITRLISLSNLKNGQMEKNWWEIFSKPAAQI